MPSGPKAAHEEKAASGPAGHIRQSRQHVLPALSLPSDAQPAEGDAKRRFRAPRHRLPPWPLQARSQIVRG